METERLGRQIQIPSNCEIVNCEFGEYVEIGGQSYMENVVMGDYSYSCDFCIFQNAVIGKFANIAAMVRIGPTAHPMDRAALHHFTYRRAKYGFAEEDDHEFFERRKAKSAYIGRDTWIGHGAIIMPGVKIGDGSVIGAGAVVTKDVPDYSVYAGCPARRIRRRFDEATASRLKEIAWWDWDRDTLKKRLNDFLLPAGQFIAKYGRS